MADSLQTFAAELARGPSPENIYVNVVPLSAAQRRIMERDPVKWAHALAADDAYWTALSGPTRA